VEDWRRKKLFLSRISRSNCGQSFEFTSILVTADGSLYWCRDRDMETLTTSTGFLFPRPAFHMNCALIRHAQAAKLIDLFKPNVKSTSPFGKHFVKSLADPLPPKSETDVYNQAIANYPMKLDLVTI
jgi:hypothetical protein